MLSFRHSIRCSIRRDRKLIVGDPTRQTLHARLLSSSPKRPSPQPSGLVRWSKRAIYTSLAIGTIWGVDKELNASAIGRNVRTLWTCMLIALDYKVNFTPENASGIPALHERVANRVYDLLTANGGLYIKIGQAIGNNAALMPRPMQEKFAKLFDDAPQIPYEDVEKVLRDEFGRPPSGPDGIFEEFEETAVASASVAQVHRAKLRTPDGNGPWVAVKIQKPDVSKQVEWDLGAFRIVMWLYENYLFDMPAYFVVDFISDHLRRELDFEREAMNAMRTAEFVASEPRLADKVYIPIVYPEYTTKKVLVMEWIDGVRLSDRAGVLRLMGEEDDRTSSKNGSGTTDRLPIERFGKLKGGIHSIMHTMVELFSAQIFSWGWVHCDPHPGNVIIRPNPSHPSIPQLVLIDHGLYVRLTDDFRRQYATLWRGLMTIDFGVIKKVAVEWGIGTPDLFASATLMRPIKFRKQDDPEGARMREEFENMDQYERSVKMKERLKGFLTDTDKMPKELMFIGRNMRIVQGNNQIFGSPVNRIRITGYWASRSLTTSPSLNFVERFREYTNYVSFLVAAFVLDMAFWTSKINQWIRIRFGMTNEGFEDQLERTMRGFAKSNFGVDIADDAFQG